MARGGDASTGTACPWLSTPNRAPIPGIQLPNPGAARKWRNPCHGVTCPRAGQGLVPGWLFPRGAAQLCRAGLDGEPSVWPGRRRFPAPRWPWARLRNETPCTTPQLAAHRELPLTAPRGIKPRHATARADPGEPVEQVSGPSATTGWGSVPRGPITPLHPPAPMLSSATTCRWGRDAAAAGTCPGSSPHPGAPSSPCAQSQSRRRRNSPQAES